MTESRHRAPRHHLELRLLDDDGRGRAAADRPDHPRQRQRLRAAGRGRGLSLALHRDGAYSLYSDGVTGENYLRGVQEADADGKLTFTSIFPGAYAGRWPHIHFEVYASLDEATSAGPIKATSQIALPQDVCEQVYATDGYEQSIANLAQTSLQTDMVFSDDGGARQLATMSGSVAERPDRHPQRPGLTSKRPLARGWARSMRRGGAAGGPAAGHDLHDQPAAAVRAVARRLHLAQLAAARMVARVQRLTAVVAVRGTLGSAPLGHSVLESSLIGICSSASSSRSSSGSRPRVVR